MDISLPDDLEFAEEGRDHDDTELRFTEDGILIEPFNLGAERSGGYFDNEDNYVARVNKDDTDAWMQAMEGAPLLPHRSPVSYPYICHHIPHCGP